MNQGEWIEFSLICRRPKGDPVLYPGPAAANADTGRDNVRRERWNHETREWEEIE